jgi:hypothetical protein
MNQAKPAPAPQPRIFRDKLSREMAFPLGYELLERAFCDLPQWPRCEFWFQARPTYWASDFARTLAALEPYPIVCVRHRPSPSGFSFEIYPVTRSLKSIARQSFFTSALEAFRQFLIAEPAAPNLRDLRVAFFDPVSHSCTVRTSTH